MNIPKYELELANTARLLALNSNSMDKNLGNFLSTTELADLGEDLDCADPIRASTSYYMIHRLRNAPNTYQTSHSTKGHLPTNMTWPSMQRSYE